MASQRTGGGYATMHLLTYRRDKTLCGLDRVEDRGYVFNVDQATCRNCVRKSSDLVYAGAETIKAGTKE